MAKVKIPFAVRDQVWTFAMEDHGTNDYIVNFIVRHGLAEYEKSLPLLLAGFALTFGENFLDIGANTGLYSFLYGTLAPDAVVHAFEPLPQIAEALAGNVQLNPHLVGRIHLERFALSDREGAVTFYETISKYYLSTSSSLVEGRAKSIGKYRRRQLEFSNARQCCRASGSEVRHYQNRRRRPRSRRSNRSARGDRKKSADYSYRSSARRGLPPPE